MFACFTAHFLFYAIPETQPFAFWYLRWYRSKFLIFVFFLVVFPLFPFITAAATLDLFVFPRLRSKNPVMPDDVMRSARKVPVADRRP